MIQTPDPAANLPTFLIPGVLDHNPGSCFTIMNKTLEGTEQKIQLV